jgi:hypothetical protein
VAVDAINRGQIAKFIRKPWEPEEMVATLREGNDAFRGSQADELRRRLSDPATVLRHNLDWSVKALVSLDPTLRTALPSEAKTYHGLCSAVQESNDAVDQLCREIDTLDPNHPGSGRRR